MIRNLIRKGTITQIYPPQENGITRAQVTFLVPEAPEDVVLWMPYGINSCPTIGSQVIVMAVYGNLEDKFAFPDNIDEAPIIKLGESIVYNNFGSSIYLKENGDIDVVATKDVNVTAININGTATTAANITAPAITLDGDVSITGTLEVDGDSTLTGAGTSIAGKVFLAHTHTGVTSGVDNSGGVTP